jgi:hypothetical protein
MRIPITTSDNIILPIDGQGVLFVDAIDKSLKCKRPGGIIQFSSNLTSNELRQLGDYTAFEVYPTSRAYAPGEFQVKGYTNAEEIVASDSHHFKIRSIYTLAEQDVIIDWGDGTLMDIKNGGDDVIDEGTEFLVRHKYTELDKPYIVKIYGSTYFGFMCETSTSKFDDGTGNAKSYLNHNLMSRIFDKDLPVATCVMNAASMCRYGKRLLSVSLYGHSIIRQVSNWTLCFSACTNLRSAWGFQDDNLRVTACSEMFANCKAMIKTDFRIPDCPRSESVATSIFNECNSLECDVLDLLPRGNFLTSPYKIGKVFYNAGKLQINADNIEKLGNKLWNNPYVTFTTTTNAFKGKQVSADVKALIPASWGGTASDDIIIKKYSEKITELEAKVVELEALLTNQK